MICRYCKKEVEDDSAFCRFCGKTLTSARSPKQRGNGQGSVYRLKNGKYKAVATAGYWLDCEGKLHRKTRSKTFERKKDAIAALPELLVDRGRETKTGITFGALYERWLPTHRAGKDTINCYKAAARYLRPVWLMRMADIDVDDLQECIDECPHGKRTKENMRTVIGLVYKFGIPRRAVPDNLSLSPFLSVSGDGAAHRASFTTEQVEQIRAACGIVPYADDVLMLCYLGFRPSEYLELTAADYDAARRCLTGGAKTEAGRGRVVTVSPRILPLVEARAASGGPICRDDKGRAWGLKAFTEDAFYPALEQIGIDNPMVEIGGGKMRHKYTPHSCRHTFATMMKRIQGSDKDKQALIGHASGEQLRYYQDAPIEDLRRITDEL